MYLAWLDRRGSLISSGWNRGREELKGGFFPTKFIFF